MTTHGIIFDCDGTLIDSLTGALDSFNYALEKIGEAPRAIEEIKKYFGAGADRIFANLLGDPSRGLEAFEHYMDHQSQVAHGIRLHAGIRELLDLLRSHDVPMGIVTGRHARDLEIVLGPHDLASYFSTLIADSHLPKSKPAPDGILLAASRMNLDPKKTLYVGDSATDLQAAKAAGATGVAALWDTLAKVEEMKKEKPGYLAQRPMDVWTSFQSFAGLKEGNPK